MTEAEKDLLGEDDMQDSRIYEAAFHLVPHLDEAGAQAVAAEIRSFIESHGGSILGSGAPMLMSLAYPIQRDIERVRHTFTQSYFGWFVFETSPEAAHAAKEMLGIHAHVVRALLMKTIAEAAADRPHPALSALPEAAPEAVEEVAVIVDDISPVEMDVEKVDEEIEKLVTE